MKIIIAITGASGSIYAEDVVERLIRQENQIEQIAIVRSKNAELVWQHELGTEWPKHSKIQYYEKNDFMAPFASGSAKWDSMLIVPASMGTIGRIANGISDDLITRAADVMLKEEKKLIVCPRELPFNQIHLKNLLQIQQAGATVIPTSPSFYSKPKDIKALIGTVTSRIIDHIGLQAQSYRWGE
jgi:4-hydroxy-3-polyprenylbenzoate decarboxylase